MGFDVLDAGAFYAGLPFSSAGGCITTTEVLDEIRHIKRSQQVVEAIIGMNRVTVMEPDGKSLDKARRAAEGTGDWDLSGPDLSVLALAVQTGGRIVTDDYAVSNVAAALGIMVLPIATGGIKKKGRWIHYCPACRKNYDRGEVCVMCGNRLRRKLI